MFLSDIFIQSKAALQKEIHDTFKIPLVSNMRLTKDARIQGHKEVYCNVVYECECRSVVIRRRQYSGGSGFPF